MTSQPPIEVLVVEDNPGDAILTSEMLDAGSQSPINTRHAATLEEAESRVDGVDVVLLDLQLPDSRGLETVIRLHSTAPDVPVVVLTGLEDEHVALKAVEYGAQDYLVKGQISPHTLYRAVQHAIGRFEMVKDLERTLQRVQSRETSLRNLISGTADGMIVTDVDGVVLFVNRAAEALLGRRSDQLVGEQAPLPVDSDSPEEITAEGPLGDSRVLEIRSVDVVWDGAPARLLSLYDLSERRLAEETLRRNAERLRQAERLDSVGRLAGGLAHDFNNLLTVITGYTNFLLDDLDEDDDHYQHAQEIQRAAARAERLVDQLLAFGRKQMLQVGSVDLNHLVRSVASRAERALASTGVTVLTVLDPDIGPVRVDADRLSGALEALIDHARAALPGGGRITIATANVTLDEDAAREHAVELTGPYAMIAVSDTGPGLSEEEQNRLFDPFYTSRELHQGSGLGLAAVYGAVKQAGGSLAVSSVPGRGTTIKTYLPRADAPALLGPADAAVDLPSGDETVLVVDDVPEVLDVVVTILRRCGYQVLEATTPAAAVEICRAHDGPIDLLVTDVVMPGLSGRDLVRLARGHQPRMAVLYMSGFTDDAALRHEVMSRGEPFLQKPFTPPRLARKVREVLDAGAPAG